MRLSCANRYLLLTYLLTYLLRFHYQTCRASNVSLLNLVKYYSAAHDGAVNGLALFCVHVYNGHVQLLADTSTKCSLLLLLATMYVFSNIPSTRPVTEARGSVL